MHRRTKRGLRAAAKLLALFVAVDVLLAFGDTFLLGPWSAENAALPPGIDSRLGVIHVHSSRSDGSGTYADIERAARENNLDFIVISDHNVAGDSAYHADEDALLVLAGSELSLRDGHLLVYGLKTLSEPFSEAAMGGLDTILARAHENHGFAYIAHPIHPKIEWSSLDIPDEIDGIEVLNADVEWRNDTARELIHALFVTAFSENALNRLLDYPRSEVARWDWWLLRRPLAGIGSADAHARIKISGQSGVAFPSYSSTFALIQNLVYLRKNAEAGNDASVAPIQHGLARGNLIFGYASLGPLRAAGISVTKGDSIFLPGEAVLLDLEDLAALHITLPEDWNVETRLFHNGVIKYTSRDNRIVWNLDEPGTFRVEIFQRRRRLPFFSREAMLWVLANPFYVRERR